MPVYLDHNATTPLDARVREAMLPYLGGPYANASSLHRYGRAARDAVERARAQVAALAGVTPAQVIFTSGGTESNNLALKGVCAAARPTRLLYGATEHPAVMEAAESLKSRGWGVEPMAVQADGQLDWAACTAQLAQGPVRLVSLMRANNETGVIQDITRAAALAHQHGAWLHCDAVQVAGKLPLDFTALGCDLLSLSSHKLYGPKGAGALLVKPEVELHPLHHGGAQERGLRGGTENVAAIAGFGAAAELAQQELSARIMQLQALRLELEQGLAAIAGIEIFAASAPRLCNTVQFRLRGYDGEALLMALDRKGYAVSSGSACASGSGEPSHVLIAMGLDRDTAKGAVRVSLGTGNTSTEVAGFLAQLRGIAGSLT